MKKTFDRTAHFFIDGPNIDATLGTEILERKPQPAERPRWDRVRDVAHAHYQVGRLCFVLNGDTFDYQRSPFYRALKHMGYNVATPSSEDWCKAEGDDPVDEFIKGQLQRLVPLVKKGEVAGVLIATHDHGYAAALGEILAGGGYVYVVGFKELMAPAIVDLRDKGAVLLDLQHDFCAFDAGPDRPRFAA